MSRVLHREPEQLRSPRGLQEALQAPLLAQQLPQLPPCPFPRNKVSPTSPWGAVALSDRAQELSCWSWGHLSHGDPPCLQPLVTPPCTEMGISPLQAAPKPLSATPGTLSGTPQGFPKVRAVAALTDTPETPLPLCAKYRGWSPLTLQAPDNSQQPGNSTS